MRPFVIFMGVFINSLAVVEKKPIVRKVFSSTH